MIGLNQKVCRSLLQYLFDLEDIAHHCRHGRPCLFHPDGYLGLLLFNLGSTMNAKHLCLIFGITPTVCSWVIWLMLRKSSKVILWDHLFARVKFPNEVKMRQFTDMVQLRQPAGSDIIRFMDNVLFPVKCTDNCIEQNAFYCGYICDTTVNYVFAYGPDGKVFFCAINFLGSWALGCIFLFSGIYLLDQKKRSCQDS
jgi:hypothetical protein